MPRMQPPPPPPPSQATTARRSDFTGASQPLSTRTHTHTHKHTHKLATTLPHRRWWGRCYPRRLAPVFGPRESRRSRTCARQSREAPGDICRQETQRPQHGCEGLTAAKERRGTKEGGRKGATGAHNNQIRPDTSTQGSSRTDCHKSRSPLVGKRRRGVEDQACVLLLAVSQLKQRHVGLGERKPGERVG